MTAVSGWTGGRGRSGGRRRDRRGLRAVALPVAGALLLAPLAACSSSGAPAAKPTASLPSASIGASGYRYPEGITVNVVSAKAVTVGPHAVGASNGNSAVALTLSLRNDTAAPIDTSTTRVTLTYGAKATEARHVIDKDNKLGKNFVGMLEPGQTRKVTLGFAVPIPDLDQLSVSMTPGTSGAGPVLFTGAAAG